MRWSLAPRCSAPATTEQTRTHFAPCDSLSPQPSQCSLALTVGFSQRALSSALQIPTKSVRFSRRSPSNDAPHSKSAQRLPFPCFAAGFAAFAGFAGLAETFAAGLADFATGFDVFEGACLALSSEAAGLAALFAGATEAGAFTGAGFTTIGGTTGGGVGRIGARYGGIAAATLVPAS